MAELTVDLRVTDIPFCVDVIHAASNAAVLLRDCQLKLSVSLRADDPLLERIEVQLAEFERLAAVS